MPVVGDSRKIAAGAATAALALTATANTAFTGSVAPSTATAQQQVHTSLRGQQIPTSSTGAATAGAAVAAAGVLAASVARGHGRRRSAGTVRRHVATVEAPTTTKENLGDVMPDCPRTIWRADDIDIDNLPAVEHTCPLVVESADVLDGKASTKAADMEYMLSKREKIMEDLQKYGAIWFKDFELMKDPEGFREFFESLQLNPCLDPIHTSGLREMTSKKQGVYEAVNKPSLAQHYIGLHNESTFVKTATYGAFVCFKAATEGGGEFLLADGAKIIADMDKDVLKRIYERKVRISVSNLDLNFVDIFPEDFKDGAKAWLQDTILKAVAPKFDMDLEMVYGADNSNPNRLQAIEHAQSPINTHPVTGQPVWFCNLHNHSRYLRDRRPCTVPEVGMTDVYFGDLGRIPPEDVQHINEVCERNIIRMMMKPGEVLLLDNYRVLHGRDVFKGKRNHAVTWFESCGEPIKRDENGREKPDNFMNELINKTLV